MRDYYRRLGLPPSASAEELGRCVSKASADTRTAVEEILLDPARRRVYDRNLQIVAQAGEARGRLGLGPSDLWPDDLFDDVRGPAMSIRRRVRVEEVLGPLGCVVAALLLVGTVVAVHRGVVGATGSGEAGRLELLTAHQVYVKVERAGDGDPVATAYERADHPVTVELEPGRYRVRYATGEVWLDERRLFGAATRCFELVEGLEIRAGETLRLDLTGARSRELETRIFRRPGRRGPARPTLEKAEGGNGAVAEDGGGGEPSP